MRDVDQLLAALETPPAPSRAPRPPRRFGPWAAGLAVAAGLLGLALATRSGAGTRGVADPAPGLALQMVVERGGVAVRLPRGRPLHVGERVFFRVSAATPTEAALWVEGPRGREAVATVQATPVPADVGGGEGLVAYRFDGPGAYRFHLGDCESCPVVAVEVE